MGVGPGDDVVVPSFTFYASAEAIPPTGARPVFCDIDPQTYCVTPDTVRAALTPATKAVIAVHLFGNVAPVADIQALGVPVLEDAAQAAGSRSAAGRPGSLGSAATFSFYPSKNLGGFGDGGMITTSDADIAAARANAALPRLDRQDHPRAGRLQLAPGRAAGGDPARAAAPPRRAGLTVAAAPASATRRPASASSSRCRVPVAGAEPAWHLYVVDHPDAERLRDALARGVDRLQGLLPHARAPPAGDARMGRRRAPARHRRGRRAPPRDTDEPHAQRRGRRGRRRGRARRRLAS